MRYGILWVFATVYELDEGAAGVFRGGSLRSAI